jgi:beta-aspartyl-peptidase (threonine type)
MDFAIAIHGGAGTIDRSMDPDLEQAYRKALEETLRMGRDLLEQGETSLDVVEKVIRRLEDDPLFNAGKGAVFTHEGANELDAAIMDGATRGCGAVTGVTAIKNPISLARAVMEKSPHVFFSGKGAEAFAETMGFEKVEPDYFFTPKRWERLQKVLAEEKAKAEVHGTVGAVALDRHGHLAAATSTGGMTNKQFGRVGDVPVIGAGTYADDATAAISCTGHGEQFIRNTVASRVSAMMEYQGVSLNEAATTVIHDVLQPGDGGLIAVDHDGAIALVFSTTGMYRGAADSAGRFEVAIWEQ